MKDKWSKSQYLNIVYYHYNYYISKASQQHEVRYRFDEPHDAFEIHVLNFILSLFSFYFSSFFAHGIRSVRAFVYLSSFFVRSWVLHSWSFSVQFVLGARSSASSIGSFVHFFCSSVRLFFISSVSFVLSFISSFALSFSRLFSTARNSPPIIHFTVVCLVSKPLNRSEAKVDLDFIQT